MAIKAHATPRRTSSIARITRPSPIGALPRKRLFRLIDRGRKKSVVWLSGPGGSGKTTLVSSYIEARGLPCIWYRLDGGDSNAADFFHYMGLAGKMAAPRRRRPLPHLTPEYLMGLSAFTSNFFEDLYGRLTPPFVLVLDNYQEVSAGAPIHELIGGAVDALPEGGTILILSRGNPPPAFARLRVNGEVEFIGPAELSLTPAESKAIIKKRSRAGQSALTGREILDIHEKTDGWVGGLILVIEALARGGTFAEHIKNLPKDAVFDYFAGEIFEKIDHETGDFLLKTSFLPEMSASMANSITGLGPGRSARLLTFLANNNYFTEKHLRSQPVYHYHPLFREFLQTRAVESFSRRSITTLRRRAAVLMEDAGLVDEAATMFCEASDWDGLARLITGHAATLLAQGRNAAIGGWLSCLPENYFTKEPWLLYWLGASCAFFSPDEAILHFEKAFKLFDAREEGAAVFLSWAGITKTIFYAFKDFTRLDPWIEALDGLMKKYPFPSQKVEEEVTLSVIIAFNFREPWHPHFERWAERALKLAQDSEDISFVSEISFFLIFYYRWKGNSAKCVMIIDSLLSRRDRKSMTPMTRLTSGVAQAGLDWERGDHAACLKTSTEALDLARASGTHIFDYMLLGHAASSALSMGDLAGASGFLKAMSPVLERGTPFDRSFYHFLLAWQDIIRGKALLAHRHAEASLSIIGEVGCLPAEVLCRIVLLMALHEKGDDNKAEEELRKTVALAKKTGYPLIKYICIFVEAHIAFDIGKEREGADILRKLFALGREFGIVKHQLFCPSIMAGLCVKALEKGIEVKFVKGLVKKCGLLPDTPPLDVEQWPWPVRVFTLGRFSLVRDGKEVRFSGKAQAKPLLMLKAAVALGGRGVKATEICDLIWPDADGDTARGAFNIALHRMRRILGNDEAVEFNDGFLTLNPSLVRVDTWAFERLLGRAERELNKDNRKGGVLLIERALCIYEGPFMSRDHELAPYLPMAARLRSKFLRYTAMLGSLYDEEGEPEKAIDLFTRGIEVDVLAEKFYERLMLCYRRLDRRKEAMNVYKRLEKTFSVMLDEEPSEVSRGIYEELRPRPSGAYKSKE